MFEQFNNTIENGLTTYQHCLLDAGYTVAIKIIMFYVLHNFNKVIPKIRSEINKISNLLNRVILFE